MNSENQNKIKYILTFLIPIIVVIGLFVGGIGSGIITFKQDSNENIFNQHEESEDNSSEDQILYINTTIEIYFDNEVKYTRKFQLEENLTVFDLLLITQETSDIKIGYTYWEQYDSYFIDSITYNNNTYEGDNNHYWAFYVNDISAVEGANKIYINDNDIIKWEFVEF